MSKVLQFPNDQAVREQAGLWLARLDRGLGDAERVELQQWLQENPRHRAMLLEMSALWDRMDMLAEMSELFPLESAKRLQWWRPTSLPLALISLAAFGLAWGVWSVWPQRGLHGAAGSAVMQTDYRTAVGEQRQLQLPDGSTVTLNTATELRVSYTATARHLDLLRGEAHFTVAKDPARVFTVRAGKHEFKAVGTVFNVRIGADRVALTVAEGKVRVLVAAEPKHGERAGAATMPTEITVDAGKEVSIARNMQVVEPLQPQQLEAAVAWTRGMVMFDRAPLQQAILEVSRYSTLQFVVADDVKNIPVTGYFRIGDIDALVTSLQNNFDIDVHRRGSSILLSARQR